MSITFEPKFLEAFNDRVLTYLAKKDVTATSNQQIFIHLDEMTAVEVLSIGNNTVNRNYRSAHISRQSKPRWI
jgi:hypothetical protein